MPDFDKCQTCEYCAKQWDGFTCLNEKSEEYLDTVAPDYKCDKYIEEDD